MPPRTCIVEGCEKETAWGLFVCREHHLSMSAHECEALIVARVNRGEFELVEIDEAIEGMERRLGDGQGNMTMAMCRLSLPMTRWLRQALAAEQHLREDAEYRRDIAEQNAQIAREVSERLRRQRDAAVGHVRALRENEAQLESALRSARKET